MQFIINHIYIFLTVLFALSSQLIIKWKMSDILFSEYDTFIDKFIFVFKMLLNPYIMTSIFLTLLSGLSWMIAMTKFDISYAYPYTTLGFVGILVFSSLLFNEPITWNKVIGILLIMVGIVISSRSAN